MPVSPDLVGRVYPPTEPYLVGREKIREFARAVFSADPVSMDVDAARAAGYADLVAPPTFAIVVQERTLAQLLEDPDSGIALERTVHGEQGFELDRPIVAGDELIATLEVTSVKHLGGNAMIVATSTITDVDGTRVATTTSTLVVRGEDV